MPSSRDSSPLEPGKSGDERPSVVWVWPCDHGGVQVEHGPVPSNYPCHECGATAPRYVDLEALLFYLRYHDWQEDTAADAIEAWAQTDA